MVRNKKHRLGLALGSGSSRGWSHIGIIQALSDEGIEPDIVCGCSIGALVGTSYVAGNLSQLESWACSLSKFDVARFVDLNLSMNGFVNLNRLRTAFENNVCASSTQIENLDKTFAAVATNLKSGQEIWFTEGSAIEAVMASIALPGLFPPVRHDEQWLVDGGLVNPVPVSICRALGADVVIAVNLNGDILGKHLDDPEELSVDNDGVFNTVTSALKEYSNTWFPVDETEVGRPSLFEAIASSVNIIQDRITRSRMAGDPPNIMLSPKLSHVGLLEFYRAEEAIKEGRACVNRMLPEINHILGLS